jgi:hypothetical protein
VASCSGKDGGDYPQAVLAAGAQYKETIPQNCVGTDPPGATVTMTASVRHGGIDPNQGNNADASTTTFLPSP